MQLAVLVIARLVTAVCVVVLGIAVIFDSQVERLTSGTVRRMLRPERRSPLRSGGATSRSSPR